MFHVVFVCMNPGRFRIFMTQKNAKVTIWLLGKIQKWWRDSLELHYHVHLYDMYAWQVCMTCMHDMYAWVNCTFPFIWHLHHFQTLSFVTIKIPAKLCRYSTIILNYSTSCKQSADFFSNSCNKTEDLHLL